MAKSDFPRPYSSTRKRGLFEGWTSEFTRGDLYDATEEVEGALKNKLGELPGQMENLHNSAWFLYCMQRSRYHGLAGGRLFTVFREPFFQEQITDSASPADEVADGLVAFLMTRPDMVPGWFQGPPPIVDLLVKCIVYILIGVISAIMIMGGVVGISEMNDMFYDLTWDFISSSYVQAIFCLAFVIVGSMYYFHFRFLRPMKKETQLDTAYRTIMTLLIRKMARKDLRRLRSTQSQAGCNSVLSGLFVAILLCGIGLLANEGLKLMFEEEGVRILFRFLFLFWAIELFTYYQYRMKKHFGFDPREWAIEVINIRRDLRYEGIE